MEEITSLKSQVAVLKSNESHIIKTEGARYRKELEYKDDKINRLETEAERLFKRKQELSDALSSKEDESLKRIEKSYESLQKEISRYRKERDDMREMYESANSQVSSLTKNCSHLQLMIDGLKAKIAALEMKSSHSGVPDKSEDMLLEELAAIEKAYDSLRQHNENLIKECSSKEQSINAAAAEKIRAEFKIAQALKESELELKKAQELEAFIISKNSQIQSREKSLLTQISSLEADLSDKIKVIEDLRRKQSDQLFRIQELEKEKKTLKGDLDEVLHDPALICSLCSSILGNDLIWFIALILGLKKIIHYWNANIVP